jgi:virginiamycin B lyase
MLERPHIAVGADGALRHLRRMGPPSGSSRATRRRGPGPGWRLLSAALVVLASLTAPVSAHGYVYWGGSHAIGRANLNGTNADQSFITGAGNPLGIAVDGAHIYWTNHDTGAIGRANLNGTNADQSFITGAGNPFGVAVDGTHIYWTNHSGTVGRANLDGTEVDQEFISRVESPDAIAVSDAHIYWVSSNYLGTIGRANLDGTEVDQSYIVMGAAPFGLAVDAAHIYWTDFSEEIGRANLDGTEVDQSFITNVYARYSQIGLAVNGTHIYWDGSGTVGRANLDGTGVNRRIFIGARGPALAVDSLDSPRAPVFGRTANLEPVSGVVRIKKPGARKFVPLSSAATVPLHTTVDTTRGRVRLTTARPTRAHGSSAGAHRITEAGLFYGGAFHVTQRVARSRLRRGGSVGFTVLTLAGPPPSGCGKAGVERRVAAVTVARRHGGGPRLWGDAHGNFQTGGRYATVTVSGTKWLTEDTCAGTLVRVARGIVSVNDLPHHREVLVKAPHSFLARPGPGG